MKFLFILFFLAGISLASGPASVFAKSSTHTIIIENMKFTPADLTVAKGDFIVWENKDLVPHTVTAIDGKFDSKAIMAGKSWKWRAEKTGKFQYHCLFHPTMGASVIVR